MDELEGREAARPKAGTILIWPMWGRVKEGVDRPGALGGVPLWGHLYKRKNTRYLQKCRLLSVRVATRYSINSYQNCSDVLSKIKN